MSIIYRLKSSVKVARHIAGCGKLWTDLRRSRLERLFDFAGGEWDLFLGGFSCLWGFLESGIGG